jgi:hypothetical protein
MGGAKTKDLLKESPKLSDECPAVELLWDYYSGFESRNKRCVLVMMPQLPPNCCGDRRRRSGLEERPASGIKMNDLAVQDLLCLAVPNN